MISNWHFKGHALSSLGSKRRHTSIRTLKPRSSRSEIRTDITLRSVRSLRPDKTLQSAERWPGFMGQRPPDLAPVAGRLLPSDRPFHRPQFFATYRSKALANPAVL